ncbi:DUF393 domain-containing protein [Herpetosiphon gulosus]|uniref:DUF393 domain-containing protein n=1 Tax=Herpetosiphon gulosus TaxID=1973496 RepID=A0ABP9WWW7_9CHLR
MSQALLIFDGTCDFCTRAARWIKHLDRQQRIRIEPFQKPGVPESVGLSYAQCEQAAWMQTSEGKLWRGAGAVNAALSIATGKRLALGFYQLWGIRHIQDSVYKLVVKYRHRIPGDTPHCQQFPADCPKLG